MQRRAAGNTSLKLVRNLSLMAQPCVRVAATVVSEMNERLSPKKEPPTTAATRRGVARPVRPAISAAMGTRATIVPTEVPTQRETRQAAANSPASRYSKGNQRSVRSTVADTAPMACALLAKAPASTNIHTMRSRSALPAPREKAATRSSTL